MQGAPGPAQPYDPNAQCCTSSQQLVQKHPIQDLADCPNRQPWPPHVPASNGCTGIIDDPNICAPGFTSACNGHDICYDTCNRNKATCDTDFENDMIAICQAANPGFCRNNCENNARRFAAVVRAIQRFYDAAQRQACQCCP